MAGGPEAECQHQWPGDEDRRCGAVDTRRNPHQAGKHPAGRLIMHAPLGFNTGPGPQYTFA